MAKETDSSKDEGKTFTQEDVDRVVADRLAREKSKYADYDELKAKAAKFDEKEAADKSETDKFREEIDALKATTTEQEAKALRAEVAVEKGLSAAQAKRLAGTTREELEADADEILEAFPNAGGTPPPPPGKKPQPDLKGGSNPGGTEEAVETNPAKLAENVPRF